jgi:hypothetical protein
MASSAFYGVLIAEDINGVEDKGSFCTPVNDNDILIVQSLLSVCFIVVFLQQISKTSELSVFGLLPSSIRLSGSPDHHKMG